MKKFVVEFVMRRTFIVDASNEYSARRKGFLYAHEGDQHVPLKHRGDYQFLSNKVTQFKLPRRKSQ